MPPTRIATIDSGVNPSHLHVQPIAGGVGITDEGTVPDFLDLLGHGTAVAGAIREKAPHAEIYAVKVFDRALVTSGSFLMRALDWCIAERMDFINLSLGTLNPAYLDAFSERVARAQNLGLKIVAAFEMSGKPAFPGSLPGVIGVLMDPQCSRDRFHKEQRNGHSVYLASGYPRDIPGVPPERNLQGISFAVANVTGFLAAGQAACPAS